MTVSVFRRVLVASLLLLIAGYLGISLSQGSVDRADEVSRGILSRRPPQVSSVSHAFRQSLEAVAAVPAAVESSREVSEGQPGAAPRIEFDELFWDFGTIYQREEASHRFVFRNKGDATLKIGKVRSTCGCTAALPVAREIAPGEEGEIKVTFRAGTMRGRVVKHVYVDSNDPVQPRVNLELTVHVKVELEVVPHGIYIGRLGVGEATKRSIDLYSPEVPSFSILEIITSSPLLRVGKPVKLAGRQGRYRLNLQFGPVEETGRFNEKVTVRTDLPHTSEVVVRVYGKVVAPEQLSEPTEAQ